MMQPKQSKCEAKKGETPIDDRVGLSKVRVVSDLLFARANGKASLVQQGIGECRLNKNLQPAASIVDRAENGSQTASQISSIREVRMQRNRLSLNRRTLIKSGLV